MDNNNILRTTSSLSVFEILQESGNLSSDDNINDNINNNINNINNNTEINNSLDIHYLQGASDGYTPDCSQVENYFSENISGENMFDDINTTIINNSDNDDNLSSTTEENMLPHPTFIVTSADNEDTLIIPEEEEDNYTYIDIQDKENNLYNENDEILLKKEEKEEKEEILLKDINCKTYNDSDTEDDNKLIINKRKIIDKTERRSIIDLKPIERKPSKSMYSTAWNEEFQEALSLPDGPLKWKALARVARDFVYCSKTYGKIIISEYMLPNEEKTILPLDIEGQAGGEKYISSGIFFKFALDTERKGSSSDDNSESTSDTIDWMYGESSPNDQAAMKAARNDMIGLLSYYNSDVPGLHYPLMSQIDYRGFRLIALSILPIKGEKTLQYGSCDAGTTLYYQKEIASKMKKVGKLLNLKGHKVGNHSQIIYGPGDIEAHLGNDGKYYVLDFARVFPPEAPSGPGREIFYCLLRPEFVRNYALPLSSDAYSNFGKQGNAIDSREVLDATKILVLSVIPKFIRLQLSKVTPDNYKTFRLTEQLHRSGLNCRHLGRVRSNDNVKDNEFLKAYLLSEMLARLLCCILRGLLRTKMRQTLLAAKEDLYVDLVFKFLQKILETPKLSTNNNNNISYNEPINSNNKKIPYPNNLDFFNTKTCWIIDIKYLIQQKFKKALLPLELNIVSDIRNLVWMPFVFIRLCQQAGVKVNKHALNEYIESPSTFSLMKFDIRKVSARVRHLNVIDEAEANLLFEEAKKKEFVRLGLWKAINDKFAKAVASNTTNVQTFMRWGEMLMTQCAMVPFSSYQYSEVTLNLLKNAYDKFIEAEGLLQECSWKTSYEKAQIQAIRGVILFLFSTTDTIALRQYYFRNATTEFKNAFSLNPHCFQLIIKQASDLYNIALNIDNSNYLSCNEIKKSFLLLKAFYLLSTALPVAPKMPDANIFYKAGYIIYEYLRERTDRYSNDNNISSSKYNLKQSNSLTSNVNTNSPKSPRHHIHTNQQRLSNRNLDIMYNHHGSYLVAEAGAMFESAFLLCGSASDSHFTYTFQDAKYLPIQTHSPDKDIIIEYYNREINDFNNIEKEKLTINSSYSQIYMIPFIPQSPEHNYQKTHSINKLYGLLAQGDVKKDKPWELNQRRFVITHPCYYPFILSQFAIKFSSSNTFPIDIHLIGSMFPQTDISLDDINELSQKKIKQSAFLHKRSHEDINEEDIDDKFLICSYTINDCNAHTYQLPAINSCRYITVYIHSNIPKICLSLCGLQFYGFQVLIEQESLSDSLNNEIYISQPSKQRDIIWHKEKSCSQKIYINESSPNKFSIKNGVTTSIRKKFVANLTPFSIRASPAFCPRFDYPNEAKIQSPKKKQKRLSPISIYFNNDESNIEIAPLTKLALDSFKSNSKRQYKPLTILCVNTIGDLLIALDSQKKDIKSQNRLIRKGLYRIVIHLQNTKSNNDIYYVIDKIRGNIKFKNLMILIYTTDRDISSMRDEEHFIWATNDSRNVTDFMSMKWSSSSLNFDPFGTFQRQKELHTTKSSRINVITSKLTPIKRMRTSSFDTNINDITNEQHNEDLPYAPFLYFEIIIPPSWDKTYDIAIGLTPANFNVNSLPGTSLGSYAWYGLQGCLYCGSDKTPILFEDNNNHIFEPNDTVGCGFDPKTQQIYWTKNGIFIGSAIEGNSSVTQNIASYLFATVGLQSQPLNIIDIDANFGKNTFKFNWQTMKRSSNLKIPEVCEEELSLRSSQLKRKLNPYPCALFEYCEAYERHDLMILAELSKYSFSLQCLLRAHLYNRSYIQKTKYLSRYKELSLNRCDNLGELHLAHTYQLFPCILNLNISHNTNLQNTFLKKIPKSIQYLKIINLEGILHLDKITAQCLIDYCPKLEAIRVWPHIDDESLGILSSLQELKNIEFVGCLEITDIGINNFLRGRKVLESLQFDKCEKITDASLDTIRHSSFANKLKKLKIDNCFNIKSEIKIAKLLKKCTSLISISFAGNAKYLPPISDNAINTITRFHSKNIIALNFYRCSNIQANTFKNLIEKCKLLEELNIGHLKHISDSILQSIALSSNKLIRLEFVSTVISNTTLGILASNHKSLRQLSVQRCEYISPVGILEALPLLNNLTFLSLKETRINDNLLIEMSKNNILPSLKRLDIRRTTSYSPNILQVLKNSKPHWIIYDTSTAHSGKDGKNISTLKFPPTKINSVRLRKNSL